MSSASLPTTALVLLSSDLLPIRCMKMPGHRVILPALGQSAFTWTFLSPSPVRSPLGHSYWDTQGACAVHCLCLQWGINPISSTTDVFLAVSGWRGWTSQAHKEKQGMLNIKFRLGIPLVDRVGSDLFTNKCLLVYTVLGNIMML